MKQRKKQKGFTLVELLVVIAILAILATISVVGYTAFISRAHKSNAEAEAAQIREMIRASLLAGEDYDLSASGEGTHYYVINLPTDSATISYKISSDKEAAITGAAVILDGSTTGKVANSDISKLLTGKKTLVLTAEKITYHYEDGAYKYDVVITLATIDNDLSAVDCTDKTSGRQE